MLSHIDSVQRILGAFAKFKKANINVVMSVCPSIRMEQLCSHWMDFEQFEYFRKFVEKIQVSLKSDNSYGFFTRRLGYSYLNISSNSSENEKRLR
jgi:hypothetical protein